MSTSLINRLTTLNQTAIIATPSINPYVSLLTELNSHFYLSNVDSVYRAQITAFSIILGLLFVCCSITLLVRIKRKEFWLFRFPRTSAGVWISPHSLLVFTVLSMIQVALLQGYLYYLRRLSKPGSSLINVMAFRMMVWIPLLLGGFFNGHSTLLATILPRKPSQLNRMDLARYPQLINIFFLTTEALFLIVIFKFIYTINSTYNYSFRLAQKLTINLETAIELFDEKGISTDLSEFSSSFQELKSLILIMYPQWKRVWITYATFVGVCCAIYFGAAFVHFRQIQSALSTLRNNLSTNNSERTRIRSLEWAMLSAIFTSSITIMMAFSYFVILIILASEYVAMANNGELSKIIGLVCIYVYILLGGVSTIAILIRSLIRPPKPLATAISTNLSSTGSLEVVVVENESQPRMMEEGMRIGSQNWIDIHLKRIESARSQINFKESGWSAS